MNSLAEGKLLEPLVPTSEMCDGRVADFRVVSQEVVSQEEASPRSHRVFLELGEDQDFPHLVQGGEVLHSLRFTAVVAAGALGAHTAMGTAPGRLVTVTRTAIGALITDTQAATRCRGVATGGT